MNNSITYYQRNKDCKQTQITVIIRKVVKKKQKNIMKIIKKRNKSRQLPHEEKDMKKEYRRNQYRNMLKEDKQKLKMIKKSIVTYKKNYFYFIYSIKNE